MKTALRQDIRVVRIPSSAELSGQAMADFEGDLNQNASEGYAALFSTEVGVIMVRPFTVDLVSGEPVIECPDRWSVPVEHQHGAEAPCSKCKGEGYVFAAAERTP